jgi:hypothetical protein
VLEAARKKQTRKKEKAIRKKCMLCHPDKRRDLSSSEAPKEPEKWKDPSAWASV